jgi:type VI secretion system secreted protein Hcp
MAVDMFLKFTPEVKGESKDSSHTGQIDILAWSWSLSNSGSAQSGGGGGSGKVNVNDVSITKYVDLSSATLINGITTGKHFDTATLTVRKAGGTPLEYIVIEFDEVIVTSISLGGSGGEDRLTENVSLNFAKFKYVYTEQLDTGGAGTQGKWNWNISANATF